MKKRKSKKGPRPARPVARDNQRKPSYSRALAILFEDDAIIAINKPASLPAVPIKGSETPSALSLVSGRLRAKRQRAYVVHRIDRFTSGIILFAKTETDRDNLVKQFLSHKPVREYLAVVRGSLQSEEDTFVHYFKREDQRQILTGPNDRSAAKARLSYKVKETLHEAALVRIFLDTGLQNQIRAQFQAEGHPVFGDRKYDPREASESRIDRVALHAAALSFQHPRSGERVSIRCEAPQDIHSLVLNLRKLHKSKSEN